MSENTDIRWQRRFSNYRKALSQLTEVVNQAELNKFEEQGLVKAFECTFDLAWNTLKDFLEYQGISDIVGSRDAIRIAFSEGIIEDGHVWMRMIESRNKTTHTYNEATAKEIVAAVKTQFHSAFCELERELVRRQSATP